MDCFPFITDLPTSSPFLLALERAERKLVINHGTPRPEENAVFIGPSKVDLLAAGERKAQAAPVSDRERALLKHWKSQDLSSYYREQRSNRYR